MWTKLVLRGEREQGQGFDIAELSKLLKAGGKEGRRVGCSVDCSSRSREEILASVGGGSSGAG